MSQSRFAHAAHKSARWSLPWDKSIARGSRRWLQPLQHAGATKSGAPDAWLSGKGSDSALSDEPGSRSEAALGSTEREAEVDDKSPQVRRSPVKTQTGGTIIAFAGSTPNVGTTVIAFGTAYLFARTSGLRVGYLCLNLKSSKLHRYLDRDGKSFAMQELRAELKTCTLRKERLLQSCEQLKDAPNLYVLYGNTQPEMADLYSAAEIAHLIETARTAFDICVIDLNAYWDNAATVCGMQVSDTRVIVTTGDIGHFQEDIGKWIGGVGAALGLVSSDFSLVVARLDRSKTSDGLNMRDIGKETGMPILGRTGRFEDVFAYANQGRLLDMLAGVHPLHRQLFTIVRKLALQHGITLTDGGKHKRWFRKLTDGTAASY